MSRRYGAGPVHLIAHVLALALVAWAVVQLFGVGGRVSILVWFVGAVILHDALLWPLYAISDRLGRVFMQPAATNFVRIPVVLSAGLLLVFAPLILGRSDAVLGRVSGLDPSGYGARWLVVSGVLALGSALLYLALRLRRARREDPAA